jgi:hypothetical protein
MYNCSHPTTAIRNRELCICLESMNKSKAIAYEQEYSSRNLTAAVVSQKLNAKSNIKYTARE